MEQDEVSEDLDPRDKFIQIANRRTNRATSAIRSIGHLSNRNNYEWTPDDWKQIKKALNDAIKEVDRRFTSDGKRVDDIFELKP